MKRFIFTAIFLLVASQAMADFSAHLVRDEDSVMPVVSMDFKGPVFEASLMEPAMVELVTAVGQEINSERDYSTGAPFGLFRQLCRDSRMGDASIVLTFEPHPDTATVVAIVEGNIGNLDSIMSGGASIYEFSINGGEWTSSALLQADSEEESAQWNTPVDHRNPHLDVRGVGAEKRIAFKGPLFQMIKSPVAILCFDAEGTLIKDGVLYSDWQHKIEYRGGDHFETPNDLVFGYTLVQHNGAGSLGFIFNEKSTPMIDSPIVSIPSKNESGFTTSEIHVGLVVNTPQIVQFGAWTKGVGAKMKILDEARKEIGIGDVAKEKNGLSLFDLPFTTSGLHKVIFCFQKDPLFSGDEKDSIHLFIRKQGDPHLRPFRVQDSIIMD